MFTLVALIVLWSAYWLELTIIPIIDNNWSIGYTNEPLSWWVPTIATVFLIALHWCTRDKKPAQLFLPPATIIEHQSLFINKTINPDPNVCPKHGPMASCVGRANPTIDPNKEWDAIYYCPKCIDEKSFKKMTNP